MSALFAAVLCAMAPQGARAQAPPVPSSYQDLYTEMDNYLQAFNSTLTQSGPINPYPYLASASLPDADSNVGPVVVSPGYYEGVHVQLQELKAMGVTAVLVEVGFPMLYEPFFSSQSEYQKYVNFYAHVAKDIHAMGLKLIVENDILWSSVNTTGEGWNPSAFYATLDWDQYQQARAQTAATIAQTMQPDYMMMLASPDVEASTTGQSEVNTPAGATQMVSGLITAVRQTGVNVKLGAGVGTSFGQLQTFVASLVTLPLDFIDMHIYTINGAFLPNALTIYNMANQAGLPVTITECWLHKVRDSELGTFTQNEIEARNPFSFWYPLDEYFIQTMQNLANYTHMLFLNVFETHYFWAYLPYNDTTAGLSPADIASLETAWAGTANLYASYTPTGVSYYQSLVSPPDTMRPSIPGKLTADADSSSLKWDGSIDNVGVAGYHVLRDGNYLATTSETSFQDSGLTPATTYTYTVVSFDLGGNISGQSKSVNLTTPSGNPPSVPANLAGTAVSSDKIRLKWSPSTDGAGISKYLVYWGTDPGVLSQIGTPKVDYFYSYLLSPGTTYYYAVEAVDTLGIQSGMSPVISVSTPSLPTPPGNLTAAPISGTQITLNWQASTGTLPIHFYYIYRGTSPTVLTQLANIKPATTYTDTGLTPGTTYYYAVAGVDTVADVSPLSNVASATAYPLPNAPASVTATANSATSIAVSWTAGSSTGLPVAKYSILRGLSTSTLSQVATRAGTAYTDNSASGSTTYYYAVASIDTAGDVSLPSTPVAVTTDTAPVPPTNLAANAVSDSKVSLSWTAATVPPGGLAVQNYRLFRGTSSSSLTQLAIVKLTSYTDSTAAAGTTYYYAIETSDTGGDLSPMSSTVSASTYTQPTAVSVSATPVSSSAIGLTWSASTAGLPIANYLVFRGTTPTGLSQIGTSATTSYSDSSLTGGTTYYYGVEAVDTAGDTSVMSSVISAVTYPLPSAPIVTVSTATSSTTVELKWKESTSGLPILSYTIFRRTSTGKLRSVGTSRVTKFADSGLTPGTEYFYVLEAKDTAGDVSAKSSPVNVTTPTLPATPAVTATALSSSQIGLTWTEATGPVRVTRYTIFRGTSPTGLARLATTTSTSYTDSSLTTQTTYYYSVQATDADGDHSAMSTVVSATTD